MSLARIIKASWQFYWTDVNNELEKIEENTNCFNKEQYLRGMENLYMLYLPFSLPIYFLGELFKTAKDF